MKFLVTVLFIFSSVTSVSGQEQDTTDKKGKNSKKVKWDNVYFSAKAQNLLVNKKFGSIVTGQPTGSTIGNFASLDPVAGSLSLKGSMPLRVDSTSNRFSYLSFKFSGDLISESYAALFSNSSLNSNSSVDLQLHFRLRKGFKGIKFLSKDLARLDLQKKMLLFDSSNIERRLGDTATVTKNKKLQNFKLYLLKQDLKEKRNLIDSFSLVAVRDTLEVKPVDYKKVKKYVDTMFKIQSSIIELVEDSVKMTKTMDSLDFAYGRFRALSNYYRIELTRKYQDSLQKIEAGADITGIKFHWISLTLGGSKQSYSNYDSSQAFSNQIVEHDPSAFRFGLSYNAFIERSFPNRATLLNVGFLSYKDNNASLLKTIDIGQQKVIKNAAGDTTRTISKTYKAFTEAINEYKVWSFFSNIYFINRLKTNSIHFFPSWNFYDNKTNVTNIGLGYIVSFKNLKKDQPVFNAEAYIQIKDLFNHQNDERHFWNRNEVGLRLTLPFFIF